MKYLFTKLHSIADFFALLFGYVAINSYLCYVIKTAVLSRVRLHLLCTSFTRNPIANQA